MKKIAYLAPYNSTTAEVADTLGKRGYGVLECITAHEIIASIDADTYGVIPLENCVDASASESLDALLATDKAVYISKKHLQRADYRIFVINGVKYSDIKKIKAPAYVYEMCRQNLHDIMPQASIEFVSSTDRAIEELSATTCAIASVINKAKHLSMGSTSITDEGSPSTSFGFLTMDTTVAKDAQTTLLAVTVANHKGAIAGVADAFDRHDIKIQSFKTHSVREESIQLIVELQINARAKDMKGAIDDINGEADAEALEHTSRVKLLGCY
ncbi:MAG: hypothetical protein FWD76_00100 [Firmicutes bacterium]|nr:hypothetical protein [Bacillota bacterium]